jgi:hypothetical protein
VPFYALELKTNYIFVNSMTRRCSTGHSFFKKAKKKLAKRKPELPGIEPIALYES